MSQKKKTFKQRIRQNAMKERHRTTSQMKDRMRAARRRSNRFDRLDDGGRTLDELMTDIADGTAIPVQESLLDPRGLTDLLLQLNTATPAASAAANAASTTTAAGQGKKPLASRKVLSEVPLPESHPHALPSTSEFEAEEAAARRREREAAEQGTNKNQYRHHGQAYIFWERSGVHPLIIQSLRDMKFSHPTPTQEEVLPPVLEAEEKAWQAEQSLDEEASKKKKASSVTKDVLVSAETGSGKTLVFAIPILQRVLRSILGAEFATTPASQQKGGKKRSRTEEEESVKGAKKAVKRSKAEAEDSSEGTQAVVVEGDDQQSRLMHSLILSPTRELALQIYAVFQQLCKHTPFIRVGCIVGGMAAEKQQRILNQQPHVLICTPGRLWELVQKNEGCYLGHSISRRLHSVVLDEADRMLNGGRSFEELKQILDRIHCEVLPAGFVQEREEGATALEHEDLEAGRWDEKLQKFISFKEAEAMATGKKQPAEEEETKKSKAKKSKAKKSKAKKVAEPEPEEEEEEWEEEEEVEEEDWEEAEEEDEENPSAPVRKSRKDAPRQMPMPPDPPLHHRVATFVTSATLSLQTNYERRDYSARKSVIRTSNADVMGKVLQELSIKSSNAQVFNIASEKGVASKINETYLRCPEESKELYMYYFLRTYAKERTILFVNAISMLRRLVKIIEILGISVVGLHASMQQRQRLKFIDRFKSGDIKVLVATDVASRGIDIDDVRYVLHFQVPRSTDAYIHRCGRTARCGGTGLSLLLVNAVEHMSFRKLLESTGRKEADLETFALQPTVVHQLHAHLRIALQIDKLTKEISKSRAKNDWVTRMSNKAELTVDDMIDDEADQVNREKLKAIKLLQKELQLLQRKFGGSVGGKGAFRTGSYAIGAKEAEEKLSTRAQRQTFARKQ